MSLTAGEPSISFITPTLNAGATLGRALSSLAVQTAPVESIVVDGGSQDSTTAAAARRDGVRLVSAAGSSIYGALNIGLGLARAPTVGLLNADDALPTTEFLSDVLAAFAQDPSIDIVRGLPRFFEIAATGESRPAVAIERRAQVPLSLDLLLDGPIAINSMFFRRSLFERIGPFDTRYRLAADREWLLRAWLRGIAFKEIDRFTYEYGVHAGSSTLDPARRNFELIRREHLAIVRPLLAGSVSATQPPAIRRALRRWHAIETARLGAHLLRQGDSKELLRAIREAFQSDRAWPFALAFAGTAGGEIEL